MAFPDGWNRRCALTIDRTKVPGDLTDFPVLLTLSNLPSEMFDADGLYPAINGGGDIRFSSDLAGATQLPCEVCQFVTNNTPANGLAEIYVKLASISSASNTVFYVWYNATGQTQPARNTTYGLEAVWETNTKAVWHLTEGWNTSANGFVESTASNKPGTGSVIGSPTVASVAGLWGGQGINATSVAHNSDYYHILADGASPLNFSNRPMTVEFWCYPDDGYTDFQGFCIGKGSTSEVDWDLRGLWGRNGDGYAGWDQADTTNLFSTNTVTNQAWHHIVATLNASGSLSLYTDGSINGSGIGTVLSSNGANNVRIGTGAGEYAEGEIWAGRLDEVRLHSSARTSQWVGATYNNHSAPNTFLTAGTPASVSLFFMKAVQRGVGVGIMRGVG